MSSIREIRELTGLSHAQLAGWLGVSKSLIWYAETGERSLPTEAHLKLTAMALLVQGLKKNSTAAPAHPGERLISNPAKLAARHKKKMEFHRRSAGALQQQLQKVKAKHPQLDTRLALFDALKNDPPAWYRASETDKTWMEMTEWFSRDRMLFTGLEQQELLQDKIDMHLAYAEVHRLQIEWYEGMGERKGIE